MREFYRNNQPHFQQHATAYGVTFMLFDAITAPQLEQLKISLIDEIIDIENDEMNRKEFRKAEARTKNFLALETMLNSKRDQSYLLRNNNAANAVSEYFHSLNGKTIDLIAYSVMPNHSHVLFDLSPQLIESDTPEISVDQCIARLKGGSSFAANKILNRNGALWMTGYHDRYMRNETHLAWTYNYYLLNPAKANLVKHWQDHSATWGKFESTE